MRPRISQTMSTGTAVIESTAAAAMEKVAVKARGLNRRPSWAWSVKTGRKATVITRSEKKSEGPTSAAASRRI